MQPEPAKLTPTRTQGLILLGASIRDETLRGQAIELGPFGSADIEAALVALRDKNGRDVWRLFESFGVKQLGTLEESLLATVKHAAIERACKQFSVAARFETMGITPSEYVETITKKLNDLRGKL